MDTAQQKIVQYLEEAQATERTLVRVLQEQIAMTPRGSYRSALETHLRETRDHADRVGRRLQALGQGGNPLLAALGLAETVAGQALALAKTPLDLLRGTSGAEKVLKTAKDAAASEALEIATYAAIERVARAAGDDETATLAASIRADEERMLDRVVREIPTLADAVLGGDFDVTETGAADAARRGIDALRGEQEPWPGYDALTVTEVEAVLAEGDDARARLVLGYERANKNRAGVVRAAGRERSRA
jgi:ferritin-like metal-binding protein YciE